MLRLQLIHVWKGTKGIWRTWYVTAEHPVIFYVSQQKYFGNRILAFWIVVMLISVSTTSHEETKIHRTIIYYVRRNQIPKQKCSSSRLAVVFDQTIETRCSIVNEDAVVVEPTGDAPTASEWSTILLPTKVRLLLNGTHNLLITNKCRRNVVITHEYVIHQIMCKSICMQSFFSHAIFILICRSGLYFLFWNSFEVAPRSS